MEEGPRQPEFIRSERIAIGWVRKPFGCKGQFYADAFGKALGELKTPFRIFWGNGEECMNAAVLSERSETSKGFICKFEGNDTVEEAERARGAYLFLDKNDLPKLNSEEFYHFELEGMTVIARPSDTITGIVADIQNYPAANALKVRRENGSTVLIPITKGVVEKIDRQKQCIFVNGSAIEEII